MKCLCNIHCKIFKDIDMFAKEPELYYKGKSKKTSWIGRIFSFVFVIIYFAFFVYKLIRMLKKTDCTFYDTFTYAPEPPSVKITNENFYGGFALQDPMTYDVFIDERIYFPKAYFKRAERQGETYDWQVKELELEPCKLEKFGSIYQEKFKAKDLKNYYCFKEMDFILEGHFSYDMYSFFYIQFFPCVNTSTKHDCKPLEVIDYYLKNTFVSFEFQDIELTPNNYETPIRPRDVDIYTTVGKKLFQEIHAFFQVVDIQTDMDWIGFDEFENFKSEIYLKYDEMISMRNIIETDIYETGESFCDFTIKLSENVRTEKRTYIKLITILGDVGGLMEVLFTIFRVISSFSVDILYEISLVNNLFNFDLDKKIVILKDKTNDLPNNESPRIYTSTNIIKKVSQQNSIYMNEEMSIRTGKRMNEDNKKKQHNDNNLFGNFLGRQSGNKRKLNISPVNSSLSKNKHLISPKKRKTNNFSNENDNNKGIELNIDNALNNEENKQQGRDILRKIKVTRAYVYLCFCFIRKRKIIQNFLLDEGMNIISEKMDIFNIFEKMYKDEEIMDKIVCNKTIEMSDECKIKLRSI